MGYSLVSTIDPATQSQVTALSVLAQMLVLLLLLAGDGHHWFLLATANSYQHLAPGHFVFTPTLAQLLIRLSADALAVGVALAAPAIVALLAVELALAIAGQVVPQLQVFVLSFPLKIIVGLWLVGGALFFLLHLEHVAARRCGLRRCDRYLCRQRMRMYRKTNGDCEPWAEIAQT